GDDAENIGEVNDIIIGPDGLTEAVVIGVGGFLGVGEKEVAVDFNRISWLEQDDDRVLVLAATREELESAPAFDRSGLSPADGGSDDRAAVPGDDVADESDTTASIATSNDAREAADDTRDAASA